MRLLVLTAAIWAVSTAAPQGYGGYTAPRSLDSIESVESVEVGYSAPRSLDSAESVEVIPILRDVRVHEDDGTHNFEVETGNGIVISQSGDSYGNKQGVISFTHPDGTPFYMTFVADENGFQPQSDALPVAPAFPHPIPDFVLAQIEFARQEKEAAARAAKSSVRTPNSYYSEPESSEEYLRKKRQVPSSGYSAPRSFDSVESDEVPAYAYSAPRSLDSAESVEVIPILRDVRVHEDDGTHNFEFETANGIAVSQSGDSYGNKQGVISFTHPDGTPFHMTFVADANGFQPQSDALPVAPAFPHPIPDFVLAQIEFARQEKEAAARAAKSSVRTPNSYYSEPESSEEYSRKKRQVPFSGYSAPRSLDSVESDEVPAYAYSAPRSLDSDESYEIIPTLRDVRVHEDDGTHNFEFETANGIEVSQSGDSYGNKQGVISFTHPDGTPFHMSFVADANGFQPQSDALPVAPAFPHPIPDFVLRQIEKARLEDEAAARAAKSSVSAPRSGYYAPTSSEEN